MIKPTLTLFSTDHCRLCDQAFDLLASMPDLAGQTLDVVDVAHDDDLLARYGERLPVLKWGSAELAWPFTRDTVRAWLTSEA
ncbi:MAG: glutaredoxin family protein [Proteobacteria bacterium]|nr:glutaredoxin family protein [Pseudomonadota bacterium]